MKIKKEDDIQIVKNFMNAFIDYNGWDSEKFYQGIANISDGIIDYKDMDEEKMYKSIGESLNKDKEELIKKIKEEGDNEKHLINFLKFIDIIKDTDMNDEMKKFLLYKMKEDVPEGNSIVDLNYEVIEKIIGEK